MRVLQNISIRHKLTLIATAISGVALLLGCGVFALAEQRAFRVSVARDFAILADIFDDNVAPGLAFNDAAAITQTLASLSAHQRILGACVYNNQGAIVAAYLRPGQEYEFKFPPTQASGQSFGDGQLNSFKDVALAGEKIGSVYIATGLGELRDRAKRYIQIVTGLLLGCSAVAFGLTSRLQKIISGPIVDLADTVATVGRDKNYAVRAVKRGNDELGQLIDGFNAMLAQIQVRDAELQQSREKLEQRVVERTAALQGAQQEAAQHADQLRFIFEAVPVGVSWVRYRPSEYLVNDGFFRISGLRREDLLEHANIRAITHPDDLKQQDLLRAKLDRGELDDFKMEKRYLRRDGTVAWAVLTIKVFRELDGRIAQEVSTVVDITSLKHAEAERERIQQQLIEVSRQAGMAEVATGVLHNVGNVLNSVNVSTTLAIDLMRSSKAVNVAKLSALIQENIATLPEFLARDPRGQRIPAYLAHLSEELAGERKSIVTELEHLRNHVEHIKGIVAMQQTYAKVSGVVEALSIIDLVDDALRMNAGSFVRHGLDVVRDYQSKPVAHVERHKILQILVNLIRNAKLACDDSGKEEKRMIIRVTNEDNRIQVAVKDNGVGIPAENLTRIFAHGFTTRRDGHGFGLHSGALAAKEMGGSIKVESDGLGQGATFTLEFPDGGNLPLT